MSDHERIWLSHSRDAERVRHHEREARREIEAAVTRGLVDRSWSPLPWEDGDAWYEAVFDATEEELEDMADAAARRYKELGRRMRNRRARDEALDAYIQAQARLTVSHGLMTTWSC